MKLIPCKFRSFKILFLSLWKFKVKYYANRRSMERHS